MENCLIYSIKDTDYLSTRGDGLVSIMSNWLRVNNYDVNVYTFILGEFSNIIIDYEHNKNTDIDNLKDKTEQLFKRFNIDFQLE